MTVAAITKNSASRKPEWLRVRAGFGPSFGRTGRIIANGKLHTVCEEARCPNRGECWEHGHVTIMILGDRCTRGCAFCGVNTGPIHGRSDSDEPKRVAEAIRSMELKNIVITSVTRDDLPDGGAGIWAETILRVRNAAPDSVIETLIPDFGGNEESLLSVLKARPDILGHNLETVPSLYKSVRAKADYKRSLSILEKSSEAGFICKTSLMLGIGETESELLATMKDARGAGCSILFLGQYLQAKPDCLPVIEYIHPSRFDELRLIGLEMGFSVVVSGPFVRSSYFSAEQDAFIKSKRAAGKELAKK